MHLSIIHSRALAGLEAPPVRVETHLANGLPAFHIVGLPETAVREARERVRSALVNSHFEFPSDRRITVNLAPADLPKEGGRFDLPIALGILAASGQLPATQLDSHEFLGELALDGSLRAVPGCVAATLEATRSGRALMMPATAAELPARVPGSRIVPVTDLLLACAHLNGRGPIAAARPALPAADTTYPDLRDVHGQPAARRALEIAAAGGHNLLLFGPPGTGKTLLASRLPGLLPTLSEAEALEGLALRDLAPGGSEASSLQRPFRSPHHSATAAALVGGGSPPRPGEISLAHGGVLFLDELPEFNRASLEALREPLEAGVITLSRARHRHRYPARFQLVAAMNPCPCGHLGDPERACRCTPQQLSRYRQRVSGPLLDRIDLHVPVMRMPAAQLLGENEGGEPSRSVRTRVAAARQCQLQRQGCPNAQLESAALARYCVLTPALQDHLASAATRLQLSGRGLHRSLRVARTIADLAGDPQLERPHLDEALAYRPDLP